MVEVEWIYRESKGGGGGGGEEEEEKLGQVSFG